MKNMKNKLFVSVMLVGLLALGLVLNGCDNGSTGGDEPVKTFVLTGISDDQKDNEVGQYGYLLYGIFPTGTSKATVESDSKKYFGLIGGTPEAVVAYVGGASSTITLGGSSNNWSINSTLQTISGSAWNGYGTYDAYFVLVNGSSTVNVYQLENLSVPQGQSTVTRNASEFTKI
ncbi:MAG: hypothetical protein LBQ55_05250 [Treponema sp.]|jgi:hypothetical protein|nr:hypothetical protein [Treponema sp.]